MAGTNLVYGALVGSYAMSGTDLAYGATRGELGRRLGAVEVAISRRACRTMLGTDLADGAVLCGTEQAYGALRYAVLSKRIVLPGCPEERAAGTVLHAPTHTPCDVRYWHSLELSICLSTQRGTDLAYGAKCLCTRYAVRGTEIVYGAIRRPRTYRLKTQPSATTLPRLRCYAHLRAPYARSGPETGPRSGLAVQTLDPARPQTLLTPDPGPETRDHGPQTLDRQIDPAPEPRPWTLEPSPTTDGAREVRLDSLLWRVGAGRSPDLSAYGFPTSIRYTASVWPSETCGTELAYGVPAG
eukprot:1082279-Rhodomonas_salina.2